MIYDVNSPLFRSFLSQKGGASDKRNVVQEIEHRISIQADHIRNQNSITKTREDKYCSKIKALETLVNGTNEENEMAINRQEAAIFRDNTWFTIHRKLLVAGIVAYIF